MYWETVEEGTQRVGRNLALVTETSSGTVVIH